MQFYDLNFVKLLIQTIKLSQSSYIFVMLKQKLKYSIIVVS
jgi:hypothetical protein